MKEYKLKINGNNYNVVVNDVAEGEASVEVNGTSYNVEFERTDKPKKPTVKVVRPSSVTPSANVAPTPKPTVAAPAQTGSGMTVASPLPGVILELCVKEGDAVKSGQKLLVLEAMKMENVIEAPDNGTVKSIKVNKGDSVLEGAPLVIIG